MFRSDATTFHAHLQFSCHLIPTHRHTTVNVKQQPIVLSVGFHNYDDDNDDDEIAYVVCAKKLENYIVQQHASNADQCAPWNSEIQHFCSCTK